MLRVEKDADRERLLRRNQKHATLVFSFSYQYFYTCVSAIPRLPAPLLEGYPPQAHVTHDDFVALLAQYARAHTKSHRAGSQPPGVDEDLHPDEGWWITREKLLRTMPNNPHRDRGQHYFHSSYVDVVVAGLAGVVPPESGDGRGGEGGGGEGGGGGGGEGGGGGGEGGGKRHNLNLVVHPLVGGAGAAGAGEANEGGDGDRVSGGGANERASERRTAPAAPVEWFALTGVVVHGREVSVVWDLSGVKYPGVGQGLHVWVDGKLAASSRELRRLSVPI